MAKIKAAVAKLKEIIEVANSATSTMLEKETITVQVYRPTPFAT